jgi:sialate O-acetylesterase
MGPASGLFAETGDRRVPLDNSWQWETERAIPLVPASIYATYPPAPPELAGQNQPAALYNAMIAPLIPYGLRGFIWYQGEANVGSYQSYLTRFIAMIRDWRVRWGEGTLPFYFVQLAAFTERPEWPYLREAQTQTLAEPGTGMAVTLDVGEIHDIHPRDKQDVGHRLALLARANDYGEKDLAARSPELAGVEISGSSVRVRWHHAAGLRAHDGAAAIKGFAVAGADHVYHPADARLEGETVVLTCAVVPTPQTVRYGWADYLEVNLENAAGLPAAPFRTDGF